VATGKSRRGLEHLLDAHDLRRFFVTPQVADDHPSKPHPSMLWQALSETGVAPGDAVMLGDTEFDMTMAGAAGVPALGVGWGYHPPEALRASGAVDVLAEYADLSPALTTIWRQA
jgi:phosphoglycolate phosphatase